MLLKCPAGEDRLCPVSVGSGSWRLLVTLTRHFSRGGDRSQGKASLGVNGRLSHEDNMCSKQNGLRGFAEKESRGTRAGFLLERELGSTE